MVVSVPNKTKITSKHIKTALLHYYRFKRQFKAVATEVSCWYTIADLMACNGTSNVEVEIKVTKSDLRKEITNRRKKRKHANFRENRIDYKGNYRTPNQFYFCVPESMLECTIKVAEELNSKYGVMVYNHDAWRLDHMITIKKRAKNLHKKYNLELEDLIIKRLCSEICNFHKNKLIEFDKAIKEIDNG